jgi:F-type H+-transporting ATPase subunit b
LTIIPDWTLAALIINFLLLVYLLNLVLFRPIRKALKERQAQLDAQAADINLMETQGQGLDGEIKEKLAAARREGSGARETLKTEGAAAEASLLAEVKREADLEWSRVEQKIKEDMALARKSLEAQAQSFAQLLASKILGRELS